jgi:predicted nucleic acid-binding protein
MRAIACKWFIEEPGSLESREVFKQSDSLIAPDIIVAEVCSVAWKKARSGLSTPEHAASIAEMIGAIFNTLVPTAALAPQALAIAMKLDHPVYDCFYLALAEAHDTVVVTADARLLERIRRSPWKNRAQSLRGARKKS